MIFRFVPHHLAQAYEALGWKEKAHYSPGHHGAHSRVMVWEGEGEDPREPEQKPMEGAA